MISEISQNQKINNFGILGLEVSEICLLVGIFVDNFWYQFEQSLAYIDAEKVNLFFGKDRKGLKKMNESIKRSKTILAKGFCRWIQSLSIEVKNREYFFDKI